MIVKQHSFSINPYYYLTKETFISVSYQVLRIFIVYERANFGTNFRQYFLDIEIVYVLSNIR